MDSGRTPQRVGLAHLTNQLTQLTIHRRPTRPRTPTPEEPEPLAVPLDDGCRFDQHDGVQAARPQPVQPDPQQAVERREPRTTTSSASSVRLLNWQTYKEQIAEMSSNMPATLWRRFVKL
jgi:hypothetical protein